ILPIILMLTYNTPQPGQAAPLPVTVAIVQGNLPIDVIRSGEEQLKGAAETAYLHPLETQPLPPHTLVVLPAEGTMTGWVSIQTPLKNPVMARLQAIALHRHVNIITRLSTDDTPSPDAPDHVPTYNSVALISENGGPVQFYHKRRLVPF